MNRQDHGFTLKDVKALASVAAEAGAIILKIKAERSVDQGALQLMSKDDGSPVTIADRAAQHHILEGLQKLGLMAAYIAEESAAHAVVDADAGFYLIDPLDGTKAFIEGGDDFTVNIAFVRRGVPIMGVLHLPVARETYYTDGKTAYFKDASGIEREIAARVLNPAAVDVVTNRTEDWSGRLKTYLAGYNVRKLEQFSSALKLGLVARGDFDLYPRFGPTSEWDIAAGDAVLRAAGGAVETLDRAPMRYGKPNFLNPAFIARGRLEQKALSF